MLSLLVPPAVDAAETEEVTGVRCYRFLMVLPSSPALGSMSLKSITLLEWTLLVPKAVRPS